MSHGRVRLAMCEAQKARLRQLGWYNVCLASGGLLSRRVSHLTPNNLKRLTFEIVAACEQATSTLSSGMPLTAATSEGTIRKACQSAFMERSP